jgi:hypothetical protein
MSIWGSLDAEFHGAGGYVKANIELELEDRTGPTGSEDGPTLSEHNGAIYVSGRMRDVADETDSFEVLAWFMRHAQWCDKATLEWEIDSGPRYRYVYEGGELRKLKGVLDL